MATLRTPSDGHSDWRDGIIARYGVEPEIEFFTVFAKTNNELGKVTIVETSPAKPTRAP
jgi:hypothetical protein